MQDLLRPRLQSTVNTTDLKCENDDVTHWHEMRCIEEVMYVVELYEGGFWQHDEFDPVRA